MIRPRVGAAAVAAVLTAAFATADSATADVYWANSGGTSIGRAHKDGSSPEPNFVTGAGGPTDVALDGRFLYWAHTVSGTGQIGRGNLDGTGTPNQSFLVVGDPPQGIAIDSAQIYWTHTAAGSGHIGRTKLNGTGTPNQAFIPTGASPCGIAAEPDHLYWANSGSPGTIGEAHTSLDFEQDFVSNQPDPCGVAYAAGFIYWANRGGTTIGRTDLGGDENDAFIDTGAGNNPCGVAVDATYAYWTTTNGKIWRARLDGTGSNESLAIGAQSPCGIAVDATASVTPPAHGFAQTAVGATSDIQAFFLANTSSSVLQVSDAGVVGTNAADFPKTGDGCTGSRIPPGGGCVVNLRFTPGAVGPRTATLRLTTSTEESPDEVGLTGEAVAPTGGNAGGGSGSTSAGSAASSGAESSTPSEPVPLTTSPLPGIPAPPLTSGLMACRSRAVVDRHGAVTLCAARNPPIVATNQRLVGSRPATARSRRKSRRTILGRGRTTVPDGQVAKIVMRVGARARKMLRSRGSLAVVAEIVVHGADGETATARHRVTLRAKTSG